MQMKGAYDYTHRISNVDFINMQIFLNLIALEHKTHAATSSYLAKQILECNLFRFSCHKINKSKFETNIISCAVATW
jgi:hypothetical protein